MVLGIVSGIFITRILGPGGRGAYAIFMADLELFGMLLNFSLNTSLIYFIASRRIPENVLLGITIVMLAGGTILLSIILTGIYFFGQDSFVFPGDHNDLFYILFLAAGFVLNTFNGSLSAIFQGRSMFRTVNTVIIANSVFNLVFFAVLFAVYYYSQESIGLNEVLALTLVINLLNSLLWYYYFRKRINIKPSFSFSYPDHIRPVAAYSLIAYLSYAVNLINYRLDLWIIEQYRGQEQVGCYSLAVNVAQMFWLVSNPISTVLVPYLSNPDNHDTSVFQFFSKVNFTTVFLAMILAVILAPILFPLIYGPAFLKSVEPFYYLLPGILFNCTTRIFGTYIQAVNKPEYNLISNVAGALITIPLCFVLIPRYGIVGASITTTLSYLGMLLVTVYFAVGKLKLPWRNYYLLNLNDLLLLSSKLKRFLSLQR